MNVMSVFSVKICLVLTKYSNVVKKGFIQMFPNICDYSDPAESFN